MRLRIAPSEIVQRIVAMAKTAILENAGRMVMRAGEVVYIAIPVSESRMATLGRFGAWALGRLPKAADRILRLTRQERT